MKDRLFTCEGVGCPLTQVWASTNQSLGKSDKGTHCVSHTDVSCLRLRRTCHTRVPVPAFH